MDCFTLKSGHLSVEDEIRRAPYMIPAKELLGQFLTIFISSINPQSVVESMQNMTVWDFQFRMLHRDGNVIFVHGKSKPELIQESMGEETITLTKWSGVLFDMTIQERNNQARRA